MANILSNGTGGGLWTATTSWAGGIVPILGDKVTVALADIITVNGVVGAGDDTLTAITINGILKASRTITNSLTCRGELIINGELDYGKSADIIPNTITSTIILNESVSLSRGKYKLLVNNTAKFFIFGSYKNTNTDLITQIPVGGTTFTVTDATNWAIGDTLVLGCTSISSYNGLEVELKTITNIVGNIITISVGVTYVHEIKGRIGNLTRNVKIKPFALGQESSIKLLHSWNTPVLGREIQNLQIDNLGNNASWQNYGGIGIDGYGQARTDIYINLKDITFNGTQSNCIDIYNALGEQVFNDIAIYCPSRIAIYTRQGSIVTFNRLFIYKMAVGISSAWSHGGVNCIVNDSWFMGGGTGFNNSSGQGFKFNNCTFASLWRACNFYWGAAPIFTNCIFGYSNGLYNGGLNYVFNAGNNANIVPSLNDCMFTYVTRMYEGLTGASSGFKLYVSNKNVDPLQQEVYSSTGNLFRDNVIFRSGVASLRIEPLSTALPVINTWDIFAPNNQPVVVTGYLRKNLAYGANTFPKIELSGLGITPSIFIMSDINDTWVQFTVMGTQTTGTDGTLTLSAIFQSGNTGALAWIDGIVAPAAIAVNSGDFGYWAGGSPAKLVASNFTSGNDVWGALVQNSQSTGSMGELLSEPFSFSNVSVDEYITESAQSIGVNASVGRTIILRVYRADTPNIQIGADMTMIEIKPSTYISTINWTTLGISVGYHILIASSGIQKATALVDMHSDKLENRVWANPKALTTGKFIALK